MSDILFLNPNSRFSSYGKLANRMAAIEPPFWAGLMAWDYQSQGYEVDILDAEALEIGAGDTCRRVEILEPKRVIIVAMGNNPSASSTPKMAAVIALAQRLSSRFDVSVTGLHPMAIRELTEQQAGVPVITWRPHAGLSVPWNMFPMTRYRAHNWHCFGGLQRQPYAVIYTSLGCPFTCTYCNIHTLYKRKLEYRTIDDVLAEVDLLVNSYSVRNIKIMDELFTANAKRVDQICDRLIERDYGLNLWGYASVGTVNQSMLLKMKKAGINWLGYGVESACKNVRDEVGKHYSQLALDNAVRMTKEAGINFTANIIFGLPDDNLETMQRTLDAIEAYNCEYANFYCAVAYPGSRLYDQQSQPSQDWDTYAQLGRAFKPLPTKYLSAGEVVKFRDKAFAHYFSRPEYQAMMAKKFGPQALEEIKTMLTYTVHRNEC